jgi:hypothetical protein
MMQISDQNESIKYNKLITNKKNRSKWGWKRKMTCVARSLLTGYHKTGRQLMKRAHRIRGKTLNI